MPLFEYKGKTAAGTAVAGQLKARNKAELDRLLRQKKIAVDSVNRKSSDIHIRLGAGIKKIHISRFTRLFATMIGAGLPMVQCLDILSKQMESAELPLRDAKGADLLSERLQTYSANWLAPTDDRRKGRRFSAPPSSRLRTRP